MMTEPTIEELQAKIVELTEKQEADAAKLQEMQQNMQKQETDLKNARELNAKLMNKVPGGDGQSSDKDADPYEGMSDMEILCKMGEEMVDRIAAEQTKKKD